MNSANTLLNDVLIDMARSLLQYISESFPWTSVTQTDVGEQVNVIALRQRQSVTDICQLLTQREHFIDFGAFPTDYTDLQFLALDKLFEDLTASQEFISQRISAAAEELIALDDQTGAELLKAIAVLQQDGLAGLRELQAELATTAEA